MASRISREARRNPPDAGPAYYGRTEPAEHHCPRRRHAGGGPAQYSKRIILQHSFHLPRKLRSTPKPAKPAGTKKPKSAEAQRSKHTVPKDKPTDNQSAVKQPQPKQTPEERKEYERKRNQTPERKEWTSQFQQKQRRIAKEKGKCRSCPEPAIPGQVRCEKCAEKNRQSCRKSAAARRARKKAEQATQTGLSKEHIVEANSFIATKERSTSKKQPATVKQDIKQPTGLNPNKDGIPPKRPRNTQRTKTSSPDKTPAKDNASKARTKRTPEERRAYEKARNQTPERREYQRQARRKKRQTAKENGKCRECPNPAPPNRGRCDVCAEMERKYYIARQARQKAERHLNNHAQPQEQQNSQDGPT